MNIETIKSVYFVGAGGIGMSALVRYFLSKGKVVAGYDRTPTPLTENLIAEGAQIHYEENVRLIPEACKDKESTLVVLTPAVPQEHEELVYFRNNGFEIQNARKVLGTITHSSKGLCSRHSWQNDHFYHDRPPIPPIAHRMYRFPWRHLQELRHQSAALSEKPLYRHRSRRVRPLFPLAVPLYVCHHCHRPPIIWTSTEQKRHTSKASNIIQH